MDSYTNWLPGGGWFAAAQDNYDARLDETEITSNGLALMLVAGAVAATVVVWAVMMLTRGLVDVFKHVLFIWISIALYNYVRVRRPPRRTHSGSRHSCTM